MFAPGDTAPEFELHDADDRPVRLSSLRGSYVVLYFYPKADTPGCTTQARGVRDQTARYAELNAIVLGVSPDPPAKLARFRDKHALDFTILSDPDHAVAETYGVWVEKSMYGRRYMGVRRATYLIDPAGTITHVFPKVSPDTHDAVVLDALRSIRAD